MDCIRRCVVTQVPGSVAYLYPDEIRQAEMPYQSVHVLRSPLEKFLPDKWEAKNINSYQETQPRHPHRGETENLIQSSSDRSLGQATNISTDPAQENYHSWPDRDESTWDVVASISNHALKRPQGPASWAALTRELKGHLFNSWQGHG